MPCIFSNDLFTRKKSRILHIEHILSKKKKIGYQAFNEHVGFLHTFLKNEIKK